MSRYYATRALLSLAIGTVFGFGFSSWWVGLLTALVTFASFLWMAGSGRYIVQNSESAAPMRRDEMSRAIRDRAARNSMVVLTLSLAGLVIYFGLIAPGDVPVFLLSLLLAGAMLVYAVSDLLQRR